MMSKRTVQLGVKERKREKRTRGNQRCIHKRSVMPKSTISIHLRVSSCYYSSRMESAPTNPREKNPLKRKCVFYSNDDECIRFRYALKFEMKTKDRSFSFRCDGLSLNGGVAFWNSFVRMHANEYVFGSHDLGRAGWNFFEYSLPFRQTASVQIAYLSLTMIDIFEDIRLSFEPAWNPRWASVLLITRR